MNRFVALLLLAAPLCCNAADASCSSQAIVRAKKLLAFHFGPDERMEIEKTAKELPSVRNPADQTQKFKVFEVWGYIYKGQYRMRFLYYDTPPGECLLMGEEILEYAKI